MKLQFNRESQAWISWVASSVDHRRSIYEPLKQLKKKFFFFFASPAGMCDLPSPARGQTGSSGTGRAV